MRAYLVQNVMSTSKEAQRKVCSPPFSPRRDSLYGPQPSQEKTRAEPVGIAESENVLQRERQSKHAPCKSADHQICAYNKPSLQSLHKPRTTPLLERRGFSFEVPRDAHDEPISRISSSPRRSYTARTSSSPRWYQHNGQSPSPQATTERSSLESVNYTWSAQPSQAPDYAPPPPPTDVSPGVYGLSVSFASDNTGVEDACQQSPSVYERESYQQQISDMRAEIAVLKITNLRLDARLAEIEKSIRSGCIARLNQSRNKPGPAPSCSLPPTPTSPRGPLGGGDALTVQHEPIHTSVLQSARKTSKSSLTSVNSLRKILEVGKSSEGKRMEESTPRKTPDSLMHDIWPRPPSGFPSRPSSRRSSRPSTAGSMGNKRSLVLSGDYSAPPMPGTYPKTPVASPGPSAAVSRSPSVRESRAMG